MRKGLLVIVTLAILSSLGFANPDSRSRNVVIWNQKKTCQGSGVIIDKGILTAAHVIEDSAFVFVQHYKQKIKEIEFIKRKDVKKDLALLTCSRVGVLRSRIANTEPGIGDPVYMIGSGWDHFWSVKYGRVSNIEGSDYILDLSIYPGDSGSPLYNSQDEVVGDIQAVDIVFSGVGQGYAKRLPQIKEFLGD